ncbi:iron complex outermembrane recepter protein [Novimethylophilus kurashikiensis]|uniref:Iron complex outermembrane recepter protein n=2 Tax=Novimethylophilus kurashikiensis TaxID=1825523 RepID=A0A2R5FGK3_9PROT|nr:iron complex outermembrane recepter protein [Novimethylophilus kurashikiensis]
MAHRTIVLALAASMASTAMADSPAPEATPEGNDLANRNVVIAPVVVTGTRQETNSFDLPMSIDAVSGETLRDGQAQINLSETAARIPGVNIGNRNNYAQDLAISTRGFGARSAFGVRGVRLYADGIPMSMPDGQGQTGTFNLDSASRVEFLRGPFSALYGNSSGGVVQIFTKDGPPDLTIGGGVEFGSYNTQRDSLSLGGQGGPLNYTFNANHLSTDGYRQHSDATRDTGHAKVRYDFGGNSSLTLIADSLNQPDTKDPLGLDKTQFKQDPKQAGTDAEKFNTRVNRRHQQAGLDWEYGIDDHNQVHVLGYYGTRYNLQFQSISPTLQASPKHGGGVAEIDRDFGGTDLRWTHKNTLAGQPVSLSVGINYDTMTDDRKGYENFIGSLLGVKGALRRDETDTVSNFDQYAQASWDPNKNWSLTAGVRHTRVHFDSNDHYIRTGNLDDSGTATYSATTPVAGVLYRLTEQTNVYVNAGKGFETPTFVEMAYRPDLTKAGLNFDLKPSKSRNYEVGVKTMLGDSARLNVAWFKIDTDDEIVIATNQSGRAAYQNAGSSERHGLEASLDAALAHGFNFYSAYTWISAEYRDTFTTCSETPCNLGKGLGVATVDSGNKIPGVYRSSAYAELSWKYAPLGFSTAFETRYNSKAYVNDLNTETAASYTLVNWRGGFTQQVQQWTLAEFLRVDNIFDKNYVSSIRVGDLNGRYYEPGTPRSWLLGLNASYRF